MITIYHLPSTRGTALLIVSFLLTACSSQSGGVWQNAYQNTPTSSSTSATPQSDPMKLLHGISMSPPKE